MPNTREKLIELEREATDHASDICIDHRDCEDCPGRKYGTHCRDYLKADHLIANGVTVQKWIPVTERLPDSYQTVLVSLKNKTFTHRYTLMAAHIGRHEATTEDYRWRELEVDTEYDEELDCFWIPECWWESNFVDGNENWIIDGDDYEVTHWMPLPEPPKGE